MPQPTHSAGLFVIVNVSNGVGIFPAPGKHYVLPGDEPATFGSLDEAAEVLAGLADEHGHTVQTAPVFKLVPVPADQIEAAVERARARMAEEQ